MDFIGYFAALVAGAASFQVVGLKSDLGALIMGMALGRHPRSKEVVIHMISYKDFFLIAFFSNRIIGNSFMEFDPHCVNFAFSGSF